MKIRTDKLKGLHGWKTIGLAGVLITLFGMQAWPEIMAGKWSFAAPAAKPLVNSVKAAQGVNSYGFGAGVGGIAFGAVAEFTDGSRITDLVYDAALPDGQRLRITVEKGGEQHIITLPVHDWIAIPVARFAQGEQDAIFTLFGDLKDAEDDARRKEAGQRILNYHAAFENTLLGLRLMQADLLAFHPAAPENLTDGGQTLQGTGEVLRSVEQNQRDFTVLNQVYRTERPRSYVITDVDQGVRVRLQPSDDESVLEFHGRPYWACWRLKKDMEEVQRAFWEADGRMDQLQQRVLRRALRESADLSSSGAEENLERLFIEEGRAMLNNHIDMHYFERLPDLSRRLSDRMAELEGGNPPVYQALVQTMHYAALFRHIKATSPQVYRAFMQQIASVRPEPRVTTPTVLIPPVQ
jgi:hypothetical protein